jgi:hypothetical protein
MHSPALLVRCLLVAGVGAALEGRGGFFHTLVPVVSMTREGGVLGGQVGRF